MFTELGAACSAPFMLHHGKLGLDAKAQAAPSSLASQPLAIGNTGPMSPLQHCPQISRKLCQMWVAVKPAFWSTAPQSVGNLAWQQDHMPCTPGPVPASMPSAIEHIIMPLMLAKKNGSDNSNHKSHGFSAHDRLGKCRPHFQLSIALILEHSARCSRHELWRVRV